MSVLRPANGATLRAKSELVLLRVPPCLQWAGLLGSLGALASEGSLLDADHGGGGGARPRSDRTTPFRPCAGPLPADRARKWPGYSTVWEMHARRYPVAGG